VRGAENFHHLQKNSEYKRFTGAYSSHDLYKIFGACGQFYDQLTDKIWTIRFKVLRCCGVKNEGERILLGVIRLPQYRPFLSTLSSEALFPLSLLPALYDCRVQAISQALPAVVSTDQLCPKVPQTLYPPRVNHFVFQSTTWLIVRIRSRRKQAGKSAFFTVYIGYVILLLRSSC